MTMKKTMMAGLVLLVSVVLMSAAKVKKAMVKENGAYVVNTTEIARLSSCRTVRRLSTGLPPRSICCMPGTAKP